LLLNYLFYIFLSGWSALRLRSVGKLFPTLWHVAYCWNENVKKFKEFYNNSRCVKTIFGSTVAHSISYASMGRCARL
jgi:hypothetical protein